MTIELAERAVILPTPDRAWTFEDLLDTPDDGHRYEIIDRSLHVLPGSTVRHQRIASRMIQLLDEVTQEPYEAMGPVNLILSGSVLEPDFVVIRYDPDAPDQLRVQPSDVLLAGEVVSPSSRQMDRLVKPALLAEAGVPSYWRIEQDVPDAPVVVISELADGGYRQVAAVRSGESVQVRAPFPMVLRPADLVGPRLRS